MDNNQFYAGNNQTKSVFKWVGFGCTCLGTLLTVIFSIITCSRGFKASVKAEEFKMSNWIWGVIVAAVIIITGMVFSILSIEKGRKIDKIVLITLIVAVVGIVWAILPNATICSYNCVLNDGFKY